MRDHLLQTDKSGENVHPSLMREPGRHCDGGGLYLEVGAPGQASWMYRYKNRWASLGSANGFSIREAREKAAKLWQAARRGEDPFALLATLRAPKAVEKPKGKLFSVAFTEYIAAKSPHWAASNRARETRRYEYLFEQIPDFTALHLPEIDQAAKNRALAMWNEQPKARRDVGFYIEAIIRYAETGKLRVRGSGDENHYEAMPYRDVPNFYRQLIELGSEDARALQWTILTGARTDEVIGAKHKVPATWREIKVSEDGLPIWQIGGDRMKGKKAHFVPLTEAMIALLGERGADDAPLFKARNANALLSTVRLFDSKHTVHGFRSSLSDFIVETTQYGEQFADMCIAHKTRGKITRAYVRSELLAKRRDVSERWSAFVTGLPIKQAVDGLQTNLVPSQAAGVQA
jgi:integrase